LVWLFTSLLLLAGAGLGAMMLKQAQSAIQEASISALVAAGMVCVYALARACTAILDDVERLVRG
jgi:hypothetical protein